MFTLSSLGHMENLEDTQEAAAPVSFQALAQPALMLQVWRAQVCLLLPLLLGRCTALIRCNGIIAKLHPCLCFSSGMKHPEQPNTRDKFA